MDARQDGQRAPGPDREGPEGEFADAGQAGHGHWSERGWNPGWRDWPGGARVSPWFRRGRIRPRVAGPLRRQQQGRMAGGVAAGISARTGISVNIIRIVFVLASLPGGFGAAVYVLAWLLVPAAGEEGNIASRALADRRGIALTAAVASVLALLLLISSVLKVAWVSSLSWPPVIALAGLVLIWRNASPEELALLRPLAEPLFTGGGARRRTWIKLRLAAAGLLLVAGAGLLISAHVSGVLVRPMTGVALLFAAVVVLLGPWWLRVARDSFAERQGRIRAEERAEMASRVHDSVLQTLALIQRRADDPQQVVSLARAQERELRSWLFDGRPPGSIDGLASTLAGGVRLIQQEVEAQHGIVVDAISVGDCDLDTDMSALLAAAREATVNAAKWSGAGSVSVFAEVEPDSVSVFVRDRGRGFDPDAVPADRKGLAESVRARMARRGGSATIRSAPGEGTEVVLTMPRTVGQREPSPAP